MLDTVRIPVEELDDEAFIKSVEQIANSMAGRNSCDLVLIRIDNWFGSRWLDFSGKLIGLVGVRKERRTVPPFVPARVVWQRRFTGPSHVEVDAGELVHIDVSSQRGLLRYLDLVEPNALLIWFSSHSSKSGRGSMMIYVPEGDGYLTWYASFLTGKDSKVVECVGISMAELAMIRESTAP